MQILVPNPDGSQDPYYVELSANLVLVGANGAGKTRFGVFVDTRNTNELTVHRISAQKALAIPENAALKSVDMATKELFFGRADVHGVPQNKNQFRWQSDPVVVQLSDYDKLLSLLFAKNQERDATHTQETREKQAYVPVPASPIDVIERIWAEVMPHRKLRFSDGRVLVTKEGEPEYLGKEMSDGERVVLYLIGQCVVAPPRSVIIIDEPEMHIHRALSRILWDRIEAACRDKRLIYITHDLDFAISRVDAIKIWMQSYSAGQFRWSYLPTIDELPEALVMEVLGSRRRILFCEGVPSGVDATLYQAVYSDLHVIGRGGSDEVIRSVRALRQNPSLHHVDAAGLVDRDFREDEEVAALTQASVRILSVAEIENLICMEAPLREFAAHLGLDSDQVLQNATNYVAQKLAGERDLQAAGMAERRIQWKLGTYVASAHSREGVRTGLINLTNGIDAGAIFDDCLAEIDTAIATKRIDAMLRVYNRKSISAQLSPMLGLSKNGYPLAFMRALKGPANARLLTALRSCLPQIP